MYRKTNLLSVTRITAQRLSAEFCNAVTTFAKSQKSAVVRGIYYYGYRMWLEITIRDNMRR